MKYRLDQLAFSSLLPSYINVQTSMGSLSVSGTITSGNEVSFTAFIALSSLTTFSDIYATNVPFDIKVQVVGNNSLAYAYDFVSTEFVSNQVTYSGGTVTIVMTVFNGTGKSITLVPQTINLQVVEYRLPL